MCPSGSSPNTSTPPATSAAAPTPRSTLRASWASQRSGLRPVFVWNDGTVSNDDRLGAVGDIRFTIEEAGLEGEDLLVLAGDNLIEYPLEDLVRFWQSKGEGAAIAVHHVVTDVPDVAIGGQRLARQRAHLTQWLAALRARTRSPRKQGG